MATQQTREMKDGFTMLPQGMHGGLRPTMLSKGQFARGINISCRGGYAKTRPGWTPVVDLKVEGKVPFQGAHRWSTPATEYLVAVFGGTVFFYDIAAGSVNSLPALLTPGKQVFTTQAGALLVMGDGEKVVAFDVVGGVPTKVYPKSLDVPADKLQPCTILHFCQGRIHSVPRKMGIAANAAPSYERYFVSGDILKVGDPNTVLDTSETTTLDGGMARGLPDELGPIRGMISAQNPGKSVGLGPLLVFARDGVAAFDVSIPRATIRNPDNSIVERGWADSAIGSVLEYGTGTDSPWSLTPSGADVYFRAKDGVYSLARDTQAVQAGAVKASPLSFEVKRWIDAETQLAGVSGAAVDKRIFMTAVSDGGDGYRGVLTLDTAIATTMGSDMSPVWDGIWSGPRFGKLVEANRQGIPTLYSIATDGWVYRLDETADTDGGTSIVSQLVTRAFYSDAGQIDFYKRLEYVDLWLSEITRTSQVEIFFRPDGYPLWTRIGCPRLLEVDPAGLPQERRKLRFACRDGGEYPENARRPGMNSGSLRHGYTFQLKVVINGCATIMRLDVNSIAIAEENPLQSLTDSSDQSFSIVPDADHLPDNDFDQAPPGPGLDSGWVRGPATSDGTDVIFQPATGAGGVSGGMRLQIGIGVPDVAWPPRYTQAVIAARGPAGKDSKVAGPPGKDAEPIELDIRLGGTIGTTNFFDVYLPSMIPILRRNRGACLVKTSGPNITGAGPWYRMTRVTTDNEDPLKRSAEVFAVVVPGINAPSNWPITLDVRDDGGLEFFPSEAAAVAASPLAAKYGLIWELGRITKDKIAHLNHGLKVTDAPVPDSDFSKKGDPSTPLRAWTLEHDGNGCLAIRNFLALARNRIDGDAVVGRSQYGTETVMINLPAPVKGDADLVDPAVSEKTIITNKFTDAGVGYRYALSIYNFTSAAAAVETGDVIVGRRKAGDEVVMLPYPTGGSGGDYAPDPVDTSPYIELGPHYPTEESATATQGAATWNYFTEGAGGNPATWIAQPSTPPVAHGFKEYIYCGAWNAESDHTLYQFYRVKYHDSHGRLQKVTAEIRQTLQPVVAL